MRAAPPSREPAPDLTRTVLFASPLLELADVRCRSQFATRFRAAYGLTPSQWRRQATGAK